MKDRNSSIGNVLFNIINYTVFLLFSALCIYPFYYIFLYSISDPSIAERGGIVFLPMGLTLLNYVSTFQLPNIANAAFISLARTVLGTIITVFCSSLFAYIVTKKELFGRKYIYRYLIITMYLNAGLIPTYILFKEIGLKNNFLLYIIPGAVSAFYVILVKTYIEQIPPSLEESAMVDGAGHFTIFIKIIFPISTPIVATISVFNAVGQWNTWTDNFFFANTQQLQTLQFLLLNYLNQAESMMREMAEDINRMRNMTSFHPTPNSVRMTITMVVTLPIIFVYPFLQRYFVKGIMMGAIKG
jgi:putative aldouronate transport system permease protein